MTTPLLNTTVGDYPLQQCRLAVGGREWSIQHTGAAISYDEETAYFDDSANRLPYGVALWPAAIALAHDVAMRTSEFAGRSVLELGAGTGLPGIVAASLGANVLQSDRQDLALHLCRLNGERNATTGLRHAIADWTEWTLDERFDWIMGSDILYGEALHPFLRRIFETNLKPGGKVLVGDPFRRPAITFLESLEASGWKVVMSKWSIGSGKAPRPVGVFELTPPRV